MGKTIANGVGRRQRKSEQLPPHSPEAEKGVIGAMIRDNGVIPDVWNVIGPDGFYSDAHQKIAWAIFDLHNSSKPADSVILFETLKARKQLEDIGGAEYLAELWDAAPTSANAVYYAGIVRDKHILRRLIHDAGELIRDAYDPVESVADFAARFSQRIGEVVRAADRAASKRFKWITSDQFAGGDFRPQWLVKQVLVRGQPGTIAGPSKVLKTSIGVDLCVSIASGTPFLGKFDVPARARVAITSGESGMHTLQETARRVCAARGLDLADLQDWLVWDDTLPTFTDLSVMTEFAESLTGIGAEMVLVDPLYLCLGAVDAKNLFEMGTALRAVSEVLLRSGITPMVTHHANRQLASGEPMQLHHLAYSGLEQYARQFVLISRQKPYQGDGAHDVWVQIGGSAGQGELWDVHVEEGKLNDDFGGRRWEVTVRSADDARADMEVSKEQRKYEKAKLAQQVADSQVLTAIDAEVAVGHLGATLGAIKTRCSISGARAKEIIERLMDVGWIEEVDFDKRTGNGAKTPVKGYRRVSP